MDASVSSIRSDPLPANTVVSSCLPARPPALPANGALRAYWDAVESLDADLLASQFAERALFYFAERAPVEGRPAIRRAFVQLFAELEAIEHQPVTLWSGSGLIVADDDLTVVLEDGGKILLPATTVLWTAHHEILACRFLLYPEPGLTRAIRGFGSPRRTVRDSGKT